MRRWLVVSVVAMTLAALLGGLYPLEAQRKHGVAVDLGPRLEVVGTERSLHGTYLVLAVRREPLRGFDLLALRLGWQRGEMVAGTSRVPPSVRQLAFRDASATATAVARREIGIRDPVAGDRAGATMPAAPPAAEVQIDQDNLGGGSAGLVLGLAVYDLLSPIDVARGRTIAGTGTLSAGGEVGEVLAVPVKAQAALAAGADVFLVAPSQVAAARAVLAGRVEVIAVANFDAALAALGAGPATRDRSAVPASML